MVKFDGKTDKYAFKTNIIITSLLGFDFDLLTILITICKPLHLMMHYVINHLFSKGLILIKTQTLFC